jgi:hypothetical protein
MLRPARFMQLVRAFMTRRQRASVTPPLQLSPSSGIEKVPFHAEHPAKRGELAVDVAPVPVVPDDQPSERELREEFLGCNGAA